MSLLNLLRKTSKIAQFSLFTTPSHSQRLFLFSKLRQFYKYDISETDAHNPQEALTFAQEKAAKIYGTKSTYFLTNGSTSGIIAAVLAVVKNGDKVLIWDDAHPSHLNAVKLAGATPLYYSVQKDKDWGIYTKIDISQIEKCFDLKNGDKPKAVIITSPTYEGVVSDVKEIKEICKKHGAFLIVDEAHGALYPFCDKLPVSAIYLGADFVIQSLHKTAGGLNPTALLHCNISHCEGVNDKLFKQSHCDVHAALDLITTTSPSYPLLASIEKNINYLNSKRGRKNILELVENIQNLKKKVSNYGVMAQSDIDLNRQSRLGILAQQYKVNNDLITSGCEFYLNNDPTKILVKTNKMSGFELSEILFEKYKIEDEKTNEKSTMLLCGIGTDLKKINKLQRALKCI